ncbi:hypothetical protein T02_8085 [Trichinella nativa]|uniref:Uncharacterized protein n=1 Tax=Trichinella nativa TaxID=6335 RepID=A0A0V1KK57_9BILA|nr:hypothetical protein T02_8085 [Trichinella nativa]
MRVLNFTYRESIARLINVMMLSGSVPMQCVQTLIEEDGEWCGMSFQRPLYQPGLCQLPYGDSRLMAERLPGIVLPQHTLQDKHGCFSLFYQKAIVSGVFCWNSSTQNLVAMHNYQQGWSLGLG